MNVIDQNLFENITIPGVIPAYRRETRCENNWQTLQIEA